MPSRKRNLHRPHLSPKLLLLHLLLLPQNQRKPRSPNGKNPQPFRRRPGMNQLPRSLFLPMKAYGLHLQTWWKKPSPSQFQSQNPRRKRRSQLLSQSQLLLPLWHHRQSSLKPLSAVLPQFPIVAVPDSRLISPLLCQAHSVPALKKLACNLEAWALEETRSALNPPIQTTWNRPLHQHTLNLSRNSLLRYRLRQPLLP